MAAGDAGGRRADGGTVVAKPQRGKVVLLALGDQMGAVVRAESHCNIQSRKPGAEVELPVRMGRLDRHILRPRRESSRPNHGEKDGAEQTDNATSNHDAPPIVATCAVHGSRNASRSPEVRDEIGS